MSSDPSGPMDGFDAAGCLDRLAAETARAIGGLGRRGAVVATSGGIDSSAVAGICVRALGAEKVHLLRLPERDVGDSSSDLALELAECLGARSIEEPITAALEGLGCYEQRDEAIRAVFPDYEPSWKHKLVRSAPSASITVFSLVVERPDGTQDQRRMPADSYLSLLGGDEHEAAGPQAPRVHLGRSALLRRDGHPEPARVRPGLLRQGRRRARRREADRRPLQGPGLRGCA